MLHNEHHRNRMGEKGGEYGCYRLHAPNLMTGLRVGVLSRASCCHLRFTLTATLRTNHCRSGGRYTRPKADALAR
jgi:hypothetical protein